MQSPRLLIAPRVAVLICLAAGQASAKTYKLVPHSDGSAGIRFAIGYTMGTHKGKAMEASGEVEADLSPVNVRRGVFTVPIAAMRTSESKLNCHLREALGLDYAKASYPDRHVCDKEDELPKEGPNAVAFPEIRFEWSGGKVVEGGPTLRAGTPLRLDAKGKWTIHGVTRAVDSISLTLSLPDGQPDRVRVQGDLPFSIKDFGIVVKNMLFISVEDTATATFDLLFAVR